MTYEFFPGEENFYRGYTRMKNADAFPPLVEETVYDIRMKCPACNWVIKAQEPVEVLGPYSNADSAPDAVREVPFTLHCERCHFDYIGSVLAGIHDTSFIVDPIDPDWPFWVKEVE